MSDPNLDKLVIQSDWLLCDPIKQERDMGGLSVPVGYEEKTQMAKVIKAGEKAKTPVGSLVYFNRYASIILEWKDSELLVLKDEDIIMYEKSS